MPLIACSGDTGGVLGKTTHLGKELKLRAIGHWDLQGLGFRVSEGHGCGEMLFVLEKRELQELDLDIHVYIYICVYGEDIL